MPSQASTLDQRLARIADILAAPTLRRRERHFMTLAAQASGAERSPLPPSRTGSGFDPQARLFDLLEAATLRRRERALALQRR